MSCTIGFLDQQKVNNQRLHQLGLHIVANYMELDNSDLNKYGIIFLT